jgi:hypothetical protein
MVEIDITELFRTGTFPCILYPIPKCARDIDSVILSRTSKLSHVEYELRRNIVRQRDWESMYLLIFVFHPVIEFRMTYLTKHFGVYLSGMPICSVFVVFLFRAFPLCLQFVGWLRWDLLRLLIIPLVAIVDLITDCAESTRKRRHHLWL